MYRDKMIELQHSFNARLKCFEKLSKLTQIHSALSCKSIVYPSLGFAIKS